jgi:L-alanine-DL-glutamate epimerase-like enolase superfamily enzyme
MMQLKFYPYDLKFDEVFAVSANARTGTEIIYVELYSDGQVGYGEASFPPYMKEKRTDNLDFLAGLNLESFNSIDAFVEIQKFINSFPNCLPAKAALDMALLDLKGKISNQNVRSFFTNESLKSIPTSFTIGIGDDAFLMRQLKKAEAFPFIKIKLNGDINYVKHAITFIKSNTQTPLGVDFNQGVSNKKLALKLLKWLKEQGVHYAEQPMPETLIADFAWLKEKSPLPIFGDESIQTIKDLESKHHLFDGVNIKLMKCGGLTNAFKMVALARQYNLQLMLGCMAESVCAITAAANLANLFDKVDLDGHLMMTNDLFTGVTLENGHLLLSSEPGLGFNKK